MAIEERARTALGPPASPDEMTGGAGNRSQMSLGVLARVLPFEPCAKQRGEMLPHSRINAVVGRHHSAEHQRPVRSQHPSGLIDEPAPISQATEDLHQHDCVEDRISERQRATVRPDQPPEVTAAAAASEGPKHTVGKIDTDIIIAGRNERPADPPGTRAEVEQARLLASGGGSIPARSESAEYCGSKCLGDAIGESPITLKRAGCRIERRGQKSISIRRANCISAQYRECAERY
jgi:hypothetical protein